MNTQARWMATLVSELARAGVGPWVVSPGSRSTPLVLAAERAGHTVHVLVDERAAAFFALGIARATGQRPALLCTSGSAPAHYLPAIMEAHALDLGLVVVSADRPAYLRGSGANQTSDQRELFGRHVRAFVDLGAPTAQADALRGTFRQVQRALQSRGPVHLNVAAAKPLEGTAEAFELPNTRIIPAERHASDDALDALAETLARGARPAIVAGPAGIEAQAYRKAALQVADCLGAPTLADLTSQLMGLPFAPVFDPDVILQIGRPPIASEWATWSKGRARVILSEGSVADPGCDAALIVEGALQDALERLALGLRERTPWCAERSEVMAEVLGGFDTTKLGHASAARTFSEAVPRRGQLMVGNSLAVRHMDLFAARRGIPVLHQRGLSGIDGLIAGAAGAARATGTPTGLYLGDISFLHDVQSLAYAPPDVPLVIVVINDGGGRIFERLPIAQAAERPLFERLFATAHDANLESLSRAFGCAFTRANDLETFERSVRGAFKGEGCTVIEVPLSANSAESLRTRLDQALRMI